MQSYFFFWYVDVVCHYNTVKGKMTLFILIRIYYAVVIALLLLEWLKGIWNTGEAVLYLYKCSFHTVAALVFVRAVTGLWWIVFRALTTTFTIWFLIKLAVYSERMPLVTAYHAGFFFPIFCIKLYLLFYFFCYLLWQSCCLLMWDLI